ncbi:hypothetical protein ACFZAM_23040 [Streptomyces sp. NPDC008079]|uniref:hypothetical protein n=1 Tax=Streptomyces sp. NPDC008079 TaxID=3364806 RepID=UPI0036E4AB31
MDYATDAFSTLTAQPDGTFTQNVSASPQRMQQEGSWVQLDPTLHHNADGTYGTTATTATLTLSGGGTAPLATMDDAGKKLSFTWPTALPAPTVTGSTALYAEVLPGVDLSVQANDQGGFSDTIIVKTAEAAQNPALSTLHLATDSTNVTLSTDSAGNISATDSSGTLIFHAPAPEMWDSTTASAPAASKAATATAGPADDTASEAAGPAPGAQVAPVTVAVDGCDLQLTPDPDLLTGAGTTYPVFIDPGYTPTWVPGSQKTGDYTYIQQGHPGTSNWKSNEDYDNRGIGVGYQGYDSPNGVERSIYQWFLGTWIDAKTVHSATLNVDETYTASYGCTAHDVRAYSMATHINDGTTWNNYYGTTGTLMDTQPIGGAYNTGCAGAFHSAFDVTSAVSNDTDGMITLELVGSEGTGDRDSFKRFAKTATLSFTYNTTPGVPTETKATPTPRTGPGGDTQGCGSDAYGWIPNGAAGGNLTLSAKVTDPDSSDGQLVRGQFALWDDSTSPATAIISMGNGTPGAPVNSNTTWLTSGSTATKAVPASNLIHGHLYGWQVRSDDGINHSATTAVCHFKYDTTAPTNVSINGSGPGTGSCTDGGTVSKAGTTDYFALAATDTGSGVDHFDWTLGAASDLADNGGNHALGDTKLAITPRSWGTYFLNVAAVDKAGNESGAVCYSFYVPDNPLMGVTPGDIDGDGYRDFAAITKDTYTGSPTGLRFYPTNTANVPPTIASDNANGPNTNGTWNDAFIAHRSTPQRSASGTKTDDMWALGTNNQLYLYGNNVNGSGITAHGNQYFSDDNRGIVARPACTADAATCALYASGWSAVAQLIAPGDMNGDGLPDLITAETNNLLWFFPGTTTSNKLGAPQLVGNGGWDTFTAIAPGNTPSDGGHATLWSRNNATGFVYSYTNTVDANGIITLGTRTQIGTGYAAADYPLIISIGDISGDAVPDLIATTTTGKLIDQLGNTTGGITQFDGTPGTPAQIGNAGWSDIATIN